MIAKVLIFLVRCYQVFLSPVFGGACRFHPSCSEYCIMAVQRHGTFKGLWLFILRLGKCHPFHPGGDDPVPCAVAGHAGYREEIPVSSPSFSTRKTSPTL